MTGPANEAATASAAMWLALAILLGLAYWIVMVA
jgi:hypothetical protein